MKWNFARLGLRCRDDERGATLITVVMFMMVASLLATTVTLLAVRGDQNANRDRQAAGALQTAEGGISQAIQVIRTQPPGYFNCTETISGATTSYSSACISPLPPGTPGWTNSKYPETVSSDGTIGSCVATKACYQVWISTIQAYNPPSVKTAIYRIHSTGVSGGGPAARSLVVDVSATPTHYPIGLYGDSVQTNGTPNVYHESLFSLNCILNRVQDGSGGGGISFATNGGQPLTDYEYDMPAAAHSANKITTNSNSCAGYNGSNGPIHEDKSANKVACNTTFPYDQDVDGDSLANTSCLDTWYDASTGKYYPETSKFTTGDLYSYGYQPGGLSASEYAYLKNQAQNQGTYFTSTSTTNVYSALNANQATNAVLYFDLGSAGGTVTLKPNDIPSLYVRQVQSSNCSLPSVVIVVRNGNLTINSTGNGWASGLNLVSSMFVPEGTYDSQGNLSVVGTLYAKTISLEGGQSFQLDPCFVANPPGLLTDVHVINYREVDTQNIQ